MPIHQELATLSDWSLESATARATPVWRGNRAAITNVLGLAVMIFNLLFVNLVISGLHSYAGLNQAPNTPA